MISTPSPPAFNFCAGYPTSCQNTPGIYESIEVLGQPTDSCEIIGKPANATIAESDSGIQVTFSNDNNRKATFSVFCSEVQDDNFRFEGKSEEAVSFSISSPSGCKSRLNLAEGQHAGYEKEVGIAVLVLLVLALAGSVAHLLHNKKEKHEEAEKPQEPLMKENEDLDGQKIQISQ